MKLKYLFLLLAVAVFSGCSEDDEDPVLTLQKTELTANAEGGEYTIGVTSTSEWTLSEVPAWVVAESSATLDKLMLKVNENLGQESRSAEVTLTNAETLSQKVTIKQDAYAFSENHFYKLPVVFHVLYWNQNNKYHYVEEGHLQKVLDGVNQYYDDCGASMNFDFVMATEDPDGNKLEEPGVSREKWQYTTMDPSTFMGSGDPKYRDILWDPSKYINVVLYNFSDDLVLGIAQFPWLPEPFEMDGISQVKKGANLNENPYPQCVSINNKYIYDIPKGANGYSMSNVVATLSHELGHFLGLYHAFNQLLNGNMNSNEDSDYCTDTPPYNKYRYDVALTNYLTHYGDITSTTSDGYEEFVMRTNSKTGEQFRSTNIMDYAVSDANAFTTQQAERVKYILHHAVFVPGPKDYTGTDFTTTRNSTSDFRFTPQFIE